MQLFLVQRSRVAAFRELVCFFQVGAYHLRHLTKTVDFEFFNRLLTLVFLP